MANFTSKASGDWEDTGLTTWNELNSPIAGDTVTIQNGHTVTLDVPGVCATLTIDTGGVLTDATNNQGLTVSERTQVEGTLLLGTTACSFGSGYTTEYALEVGDGGVINGGSGNWTVGSLQCQHNTATLTMTSGICTIDSTRVTAYSLIILAGATFDNNSGTITCTGASTDLYADSSDHSLYNLTINSSNTHDLKRGMIVANDLTITSGTFTTGGGNYDLTVAGLTSVAGTLTCNASTCSFGSGVVTTTYSLTINNGGVFVGGSGAHTVGSFCGGTGSNITNTSGVLTLNGENTSAGAVQIFSNAMTFDHNNGTVTCTYTGDDTIFDMGAETHYNLIINAAATTYTLRDSGIIAGDLTITAGTFDTGVDDLTVTGNLLNAGTFTPNSSMVTLNGTAQSLTGSWTFWSFTKAITVTDKLTFDNTATYTFGGNVTLNGTAGNILSLASNSAGDAFDFIMSAGAVKTNLDYLAVKDSDASGSDGSQTPIAPTNSTDVSGNTDWFSGGPTPAPMTSGKGGWKAKRNIIIEGI